MQNFIEAGIENGCRKCGEFLDADFTYAFQPIVDIQKQNVWGYEALIRDPETKAAKTVLDKVTPDNRYSFDQTCRIKAIFMASKLGVKDKILSINFLPNAVYEPKHCLQSTIWAAKQTGFPVEQIMFEVSESEKVYDIRHLANIFEHYHESGFITALDDFGAGHAGLNMLVNFPPQVLKLDIELVRDIDKESVKQIVVDSVLDMARRLNITILAEGVETYEEATYFARNGVNLMQGFYFAHPGYECLPEVDACLLEGVNKAFLR